MAERGLRCWGLSIKQLLFSLGFGEVWLCQGTNNERAFKILVEQRLKDIDMQTCLSEILNNSKLCTYYYNFKSEVIFEKYLACVTSNKFKRSLCKFRICAHKLSIEEGRWAHVPDNERICKCCNLSSVEDEFHFLLVCPAYHHLRNVYLPLSVFRYPTVEKFYYLMQSKNNDLINNLSKFIYFSFEKRQSILNSSWFSFLFCKALKQFVFFFITLCVIIYCPMFCTKGRRPGVIM